MLYRNFLAMETEELLRCHPIDGAILLGGCDKTTPGLLMGAISMNLPAIFCPAGFTMGATFRGERFGSGSGPFRWAPRPAGASCNWFGTIRSPAISSVMDRYAMPPEPALPWGAPPTRPYT